MAEEISEEVVLVDDGGNAIGVADKATVHTTDTPLHLAFSAHIFNSHGDVLVTRRALDKKTWPGVWTNAVCGHPGPGEEMDDAIRRRISHEIGLEVGEITSALPGFRYRATDASGVVENEICPVFVTRTDRDPNPRADEVCEWRWVSPRDLAQAVKATPFAFSPWLVEQLEQWPGEYQMELSDTSVR